MAILLHELIFRSANERGSSIALVEGRASYTYTDIAERVALAAAALVACGLRKGGRVGIYLPKTEANVSAFFGAAMAGGIAVPINPVLKPAQVAHIIVDSGTKLLITSRSRLKSLAEVIDACECLETIILVDGTDGVDWAPRVAVVRSWDSVRSDPPASLPIMTESDTAAIFYTSGSTGRPKGVVLSHRNMLVGAESVSAYLQNTTDDVILAMLPLSFDAGFSQLTTGFHSGAKIVLLDFLLPGDVIRACERHGVTGLTGVPPLWMQLVEKEWSDEARLKIRYFANTGGKMPQDTLARLRQIFENADPFLMYGLTEAFRSTFLPPEQVDQRPNSMGKAIPNAEILVLNENGEECAAGEPGELVHAGPLVSQGYWNDTVRTAARFRPLPGMLAELPFGQVAVWSGDTVTRDEDGYLYFVGRRDDMIKTSGYRVSPSEIEELAFASGLVSEAAALGIAHNKIGQAIVLVIKSSSDGPGDEQALLLYFQKNAPNYMIPKKLLWKEKLPRSPNGKIDRTRLVADCSDLFRKSEE